MVTTYWVARDHSETCLHILHDSNAELVGYYNMYMYIENATVSAASCVHHWSPDTLIDTRLTLSMEQDSTAVLHPQ